MEELEILRKQIDETDEKLVKLFERRMELAIKIGAIKEEKGLQILNSKREEEVIKRNISLLENKELYQELEIFFKTIMDSSKRIQHRMKKS